MCRNCNRISSHSLLNLHVNLNVLLDPYIHTARQERADTITKQIHIKKKIF